MTSSISSFKILSVSNLKWCCYLQFSFTVLLSLQYQYFKFCFTFFQIVKRFNNTISFSSTVQTVPLQLFVDPEEGTVRRGSDR